MDSPKRAAFTGKWKLVKSEGYDTFLKAMGVAWVYRKLILATSPTQVIEQSPDGRHFTFHIASPKGEQLESFEVGKEYEYTALDGSIVKGVAEWEGDALKSRLKTTQGAESVTRSLVDGKLVVEVTYKGQKKPCKRYYKRISSLENADNEVGPVELEEASEN